ncbi:MAG TPA: hypothetical protein VGO47_07270, partial [Chlamydiales bacterium]|nr:hypothetical protein [Chlamydiales bacterium]
YLFVISTTDTVYDSTSVSKKPRILKRDREGGENEESAPNSVDSSSRVMKKRPKQAAVAASSAEALQSMSRLLPSQRVDVRMTVDQNARITSTEHQGEGPEPLFMPGASQLSATDLEVLRDSGLGIEHMDYDEFEAMMEADGEEIGMSTKVGMNLGRERSRDAEDAQIDIEIAATQVSSGDMVR